LPLDEQISGVVLDVSHVSGPAPFDTELKELISLKAVPGEDERAPDPQLFFIRLFPDPAVRLSDGIDLMDRIDGSGRLRFQIPAGPHQLLIGTLQRGMGFRAVTHGAPGADGPCLDHYNSTAVRRYLDRVSGALGPILDGSLGPAVRALFVDSIELSGSNWTGDLLQVFRQHRGYDLLPYLPFVAYENAHRGYADEVRFSGEAAADSLRRIRYDFNATLVELFLQRFTRTFHDWCHEQGTLSRYQAYGTPWLVGMAEGYLIPDIPESNSWIYSNPYWHGFPIWNKYASSSGHIAGRPIISCESMTNTRGVFAATLDLIKREDDKNFIMGLNHSVVHGFNYSPPAAGFPGWVRYGAYFSEHNPWWPHLKKWCDYNARLSVLFQAAEPVAEIAVLGPTADVWSTAGLARGAFHHTPPWGYEIWRPLSQLGECADYICEKSIQQAIISEGLLRAGAMNYSTVILIDCQTLEPKTADVLREFAHSGGRIVFINRPPGRSPSLVHSIENDERVRIAVKEMFEAGGGSAAADRRARVHLYPAPGEGEDLLHWTAAMMSHCGIVPQLTLSPPDPALYQIRYQWRDRRLLFLVNTDAEGPSAAAAAFPAEWGEPWRWDPETASRSPYPMEYGANRITIRLEPGESLLLVFEKENGKPGPEDHGRNAAADVAEEPAGTAGAGESEIPDTWTDSPAALIIDGPWRARFSSVTGDTFSVVLDRLVDLSQAGDERLRFFAGSVTYRAAFELAEAVPLSLDLGRVNGISRAELNGRPLGVRWWGRHLYRSEKSARSGENELAIKVTTVLLNYLKARTGDATAQQWTRDQEPVSSGLPGPVRVILQTVGGR